MSRKFERGFTLIELLIVIAIIGILAAIVFASIRGPIDKAKDAKIISQLGQLQTHSIIYYTEHNGSYTSDVTTVVAPDCTSTASTDNKGAFTDSREVQKLLQATSDDAGGIDVGCKISSENWIISSKLTSTDPENPDDELFYCVNSLGDAEIVNGEPENVSNSATDSESDFYCNPEN